MGSHWRVPAQHAGAGSRTASSQAAPPAWFRAMRDSSWLPIHARPPPAQNSRLFKTPRFFNTTEAVPCRYFAPSETLTQRIGGHSPLRMLLTCLGHSCISVRTGGKDLLFDPFVSGNPLAKAIDVAAIPADVVLLTHGHGDHVLDAEAILKRTGATLVGNFELVNWFAKKGIEGGIGMNLGGATTVAGLRVRMTIAHHSSELPDGTYGGNPGGFVVEGPEGAFHHAGDTALTLDMRLLERFNLEFACLPIGDHFTMGPEDAVQAARLMGVKKVVGIHYDTFPPIAIDREKARAAFGKEGIELLLPAIGETISI